MRRGVVSDMLAEDVVQPLLVTTSPILDDQGRCIGSVHIAKDISDLRKARAELEKKVRDLKVRIAGMEGYPW